MVATVGDDFNPVQTLCSLRERGRWGSSHSFKSLVYVRLVGKAEKAIGPNRNFGMQIVFIFHKKKNTTTKRK